MKEKISRRIFWGLSIFIILSNIYSIFYKGMHGDMYLLAIGIAINPKVLDKVFLSVGIKTTDYYGCIKILAIVSVFAVALVVTYVIFPLVINGKYDETLVINTFYCIYTIILFILCLVILCITKETDKKTKYIIFGIIYIICVLLGFAESSVLINNSIIKVLNVFPGNKLDCESMNLFKKIVLEPVKEAILTYIIFDTIFEKNNENTKLTDNEKKFEKAKSTGSKKALEKTKLTGIEKKLKKTKSTGIENKLEKTRNPIVVALANDFSGYVIVWLSIAIVTVVAILVIVTVFEKLNIHVPGSREMWIGLIGAVLGGAFTMFGVQWSIIAQKEQSQEDKRLEYMPILGFHVVEADKVENIDEYSDEPEFDETLSCVKKELCTSGSDFLVRKVCQAFVIEVANGNMIIDFTIEGCLINGIEIGKGAAFNPALRRLIRGEKYRLVFDYADYADQNVLCIIRFSYRDIFGNEYYQDLPFEYAEKESESTIYHCIEIRDIKSPILVNYKTKDLEEVVKDYCDYDIFCKK